MSIAPQTRFYTCLGWTGLQAMQGTIRAFAVLTEIVVPCSIQCSRGTGAFAAGSK